MSEKVLSISVAAYNIAETIDTAVSSLLQDKELLDEIEIIIVNDGSKDQTSQMAHRYASLYPDSIFVIDKENGGYGSTINASLEIANGKYYKLLDGDDWYYSRNLRGFLDFLKKRPADIVVTPYFKIRDNETIVDDHKEIGREPIELCTNSLVNHTFLMHEIAIATEKLRNLQCPIAEKCFYTDLEYVFYAVACADNVARYDEPIYCYRLGVEGQSVSLTGIRKHYKDYSVVARRMFAFYEKNVSSFTGSKKAALSASACDYTYHTYRAYTMLENPKEMKKELVALDREIQQSYPNVYTLGFNSKLVRYLRKSRFMLYPLFCRKYQ